MSGGRPRMRSASSSLSSPMSLNARTSVSVSTPLCALASSFSASDNRKAALPLVALSLVRSGTWPLGSQMR